MRQFYASNGFPRTRSTRKFCVGIGILGLLSCQSIASLAEEARPKLAAGDIVVLDIGIGGNVGPEILFRVDPLTGERTVIQKLRDIDPTDVDLAPSNVAVERSGKLLVIDSSLGAEDIPALYRLDPETGERTILTRFNELSPSAERTIYQSNDLAVEKSGAVLVLVGTLVPDPETGANSGAPMLFRVDAHTGEASLLTDFSGVKRCLANSTTPVRAIEGRAVTVGPSGELYVALIEYSRDNLGCVYRVDPQSGTASFVAATPQDPSTGFPVEVSDLAGEASGTLLAIAPYAGPAGNGKLFRLEPSSGEFTELTDFGAGPFESLGFKPVAVAVEASGPVLVADMDASRPANDNGSVWRIDPKTGERNVLSNFGEDPNQGLNPYAIAIVPELGADVEEFASFSANLKTKRRQNRRIFQITGDFMLGTATNGLSPTEENVTLQIGDHALTVPAGMFSEYNDNRFVFAGTLDSGHVFMKLTRRRDNVYKFVVTGEANKFHLRKKTVSVSLEIGDDRGHINIR